LLRGLKFLERVGPSRWGPPPVVDGRRLNPSLHAVLQFGHRAGQTDLVDDVGSMRSRLRRLAGIGMFEVVNVEVTERWFSGPDQDLAVRIYRAHGAVENAPAIMYIHGGGWALGDLDTHDRSCRLLATTTGATVCSVDYRRPPEHPFPAPLEDCLASWLWLHDHADELSIDSERVAVMGDSAGANLAAVLAIECRSNDLPAPIVQGLIYPVVDDVAHYASTESCGEGFGLDLDTMHWMAGMYVPDEADHESPRVFPIKSDDLSGVAPALVVTAGFDPLRDQGFAYTSALRSAGVTVVDRCFDDMVHGFFGAGLVPSCGAAATEVCNAMGRLMDAVTQESMAVPAASAARAGIA